MTKKFWISVVVMFVLSMVPEFLVHGYFLAPEYAKLANLFRQGADVGSHFAVMLLAHASIAVGFTWVYLRGREDKPFVAQGLRYGVGVAMLSTIPVYLIYLAVHPMPDPLVMRQIAFDTAGILAMGIVLAWINK